MKIQFIILLMFAWVNLFSYKTKDIEETKDTARYQFNIKESSRILNALNAHLKYDEFDALQYYMADTLHLVVDRVLYECNSAFAIDILQRTRNVVKNNDYKYKLKVTEDKEEEGFTYDYIYYGYSKHKTKDGYTVYDKYEVTLEFVEYKKKIIFIAIILSIMDSDD